MANVTRELQDTLRLHPEHTHVYFTKDGRHSFDVFQQVDGDIIDGQYVPVDTKGKEVKLFAKLGAHTLKERRLIPGLNLDGVTENIYTGDPNSEIVETLTREDVLAVDTEPKENSIFTSILNAPLEEQMKIAALFEGLKTNTKSEGGKKEK